jgi:hypothetical protein
MSAMSLPGFTADASVYKTRVHYHSHMARALDQANGVSPQQGCGDIGKPCNTGYDCCTGFCSYGYCDCFDVGEDCRFGPWSCCSGQCGADGTCVSAASINVNWVPFQDGLNGLVIVTGRNFTPNSRFRVIIDPCNGQVGPIVTTDAGGEFTTWVRCRCGGVTSVRACDPNSIHCAHGSAQMTC